MALTGKSTRFRVENPVYDDRFYLRMALFDQASHRVDLATSVTFVRVDEGTADPPGDPLLKLTREDLQGLADELWRAGIRPREAMSSDGERAAMQRHIADLQRMAFKDAPPDQPKSKEGASW